MYNFTILDTIKDLKKERDFIAGNWQGDLANLYLHAMDNYINTAVAIEKCLEGVNQGMEYVSAQINPDENGSKSYGSKSL